MMMNILFCVELAGNDFRYITLPQLGTAERVEATLLEEFNSAEAALMLTRMGGRSADSYLSAMLSAGFQPHTYLFTANRWFRCPTPHRSQWEPLTSDETGGYTDKQWELMERISRSHHFVDERESLLAAMHTGTEQDCSLLLDWVIREVKVRRDAERTASRRAA